MVRNTTTHDFSLPHYRATKKCVPPAMMIATAQASFNSGGLNSIAASSASTGTKNPLEPKLRHFDGSGNICDQPGTEPPRMVSPPGLSAISTPRVWTSTDKLLPPHSKARNISIYYRAGL